MEVTDLTDLDLAVGNQLRKPQPLPVQRRGLVSINLTTLNSISKIGKREGCASPFHECTLDVLVG
jgi:hypothetical protein